MAPPIAKRCWPSRALFPLNHDLDRRISKRSRSAAWGRGAIRVRGRDRMRTTLTPCRSELCLHGSPDMAVPHLTEVMSWQGSRLGAHWINHHRDGHPRSTLSHLSLFFNRRVCAVR